MAPQSSSTDAEDELFGDLTADDHHHREDEDANPQQATARPPCSSDCGGDGLARHEMRANEENFRKMGYLEAYDAAKDARLQDGFEAGYRETVDRAIGIGKILGELTAGRRMIGPTSSAAAAPAITATSPKSMPSDHNTSTSSSNTSSRNDEEKVKKVATAVRRFLDDHAQADTADELLARLAIIEIELRTILQIDNS